MPPSIEEVSQELRDVALQVSNAHDRSEERDLVLAAHESVERVSQRYKELMETLSDGEKMKLDRQLGRRLVDLKRSASLLPRVGAVVTHTPDRQVSGPSGIGERRITGLSWGAGTRASGGHQGLKVGGDVEAWCGPCAELTTHSIVAMVGEEPRQVVCQVCNNRHNFRTAPARRTGAAASAEASTGKPAGQEKAKADKKAEEQRTLAREVLDATEVKTFDPKERYRSGEVIYHPDFGRGKVETVLRSSLLVRFTQGGLKSLMLH